MFVSFLIYLFPGRCYFISHLIENIRNENKEEESPPKRGGQYFYDRRNPEDNTSYNHESDERAEATFNEKIYSNIERVLKKGPLISSFYNEGFADYENVIESKAFEGIADPDEIHDLARVKADKMKADAEQQPNIEETKNMNPNKEEFNIQKWLKNEDENMELDSEEELQLALKSERENEEMEKKEDENRQIEQEKEEMEKNNERSERFLEWFKNKQHL